MISAGIEFSLPLHFVADVVHIWRGMYLYYSKCQVKKAFGIPNHGTTHQEGLTI